MENARMRQRSTLRGWADLPTHLLSTIFGLLPSHRAVSQVCVHWRWAVLMPARPVLLRPVVDSPSLDQLPFAPVSMEVLLPSSLNPRQTMLVLSTDQTDSPSCYRYIALSSPSIDAELRFVGGNIGVPLFVDDRRRRLEVRRLITLPGGSGSSADATVLTIALPEGVEPHDVYMGSLSVSNSRFGSMNWLPSGITSVLLVTRYELFGIIAVHLNSLTSTSPSWSRLGITEPGVGESLEQQGEKRTFVSILLAKDGDHSNSAAYYLLDVSRRLAMIRLYSSPGGTVLELRELPVLNNLLLQFDLRITWLLHLPRWDHSGDDIVCLAYQHFDQARVGRFVAFDLVDEEAPRHWAVRNSIGAGFCVFLSWGTGAEAFGFHQPRRMGLRTGQIYDCQNGLMSYHMGWNYSDALRILPPTTSLVWPFPLWINPAFPVSVALEGITAAGEIQAVNANGEDPPEHC